MIQTPWSRSTALTCFLLRFRSPNVHFFSLHARCFFLVTDCLRNRQYISVKMAEAASSTAAKTSTPADSTLVGSTTTSSTAQGPSGAAVESQTDATSNPSTSANASAASGNASSADPAESKVQLRASFCPGPLCPFGRISAPNFHGWIFNLCHIDSDHFRLFLTITEGPELKQALLSQIDYTFSREYLSTDYSIVSQMNGDLFLPLSFVFELPYFKQLTTDTSAILDALKASTKVVLDLAASLVRPNFKLQRNTIILRDIPAEYTDKVRQNHLIQLVFSNLTVCAFDFFRRSADYLMMRKLPPK
jgi:hypothetical protein